MGYKICPKCELNYIKEEDECCAVCKMATAQTRAAKNRVVGARMKKAVPQKNIAFKCNYCDGGREDGFAGFHGLCSDEAIKNNVVVEKRVWCSSVECPCRMYYDGKITREELDEKFKQDTSSICYESNALISWRMSSGMVVRGANKGRPNKLLGVQTNSLCVMTSRLPKADKFNRFIFGVFLVSRSDEGDDFNAGSVSAHSKYRISLTAEEAKQLIFWNYYQNDSEVAPYQWGTGLFRYISDESSVRILKDIAALKKGTAEEALAEEFLNYYCQVNNLKK